jgi:glycosyltransferase involved in cell wall biosynthesis
VVVNNLEKRGRRLGADIFRELRKRLPLDLVGMGAEEAGGLGEVRHDNLAAFAAQYRFFFNPIRYTSLGLAVIEAMMIGMPVVGLATTEMATVIRSGENGIADTDVDRLVEGMKRLLADPIEARRLGEAGQRTALARFNIERFAADWDRAFTDMMRFRHERFVA